MTILNFNTEYVDKNYFPKNFSGFTMVTDWSLGGGKQKTIF